MKEKTLEHFIALKKLGHKELYMYAIGGLDFIFRPLTYSEFDSITQLEQHIDSIEVNEAINSIAVLYSEIDMEDWLDRCSVTAPDNLAEAILRASGFDSQETFLEKLDKAREASGEVNSLLIIVICKAFPSMTPADISSMTLEDQLMHFALAEEIVENKIDLRALLNGESPNSNSAPELPIPPGMETTDMASLLSPNAPGLQVPGKDGLK